MFMNIFKYQNGVFSTSAETVPGTLLLVITYTLKNETAGAHPHCFGA